MVGYQGARGENPLSAVNIETLISAVRLLRVRDDHEMAPFVANWAPSLSNFGSTDLPTSAGRKIAKTIKGMSSDRGTHFAESELTDAVAEIARAAVRPDLEKPFAKAETFILKTLVELLGAHKDVSYFAPLLDLASTQPGGLDIITLNYDLTVETAAKDRGTSINRGIDSWQPGENLVFDAVDGQVNLLKLHGSLDWRLSPPAGYYQSHLSPRGIEVVESIDPESTSEHDLPWIVVGTRDKLATDGPTLALNAAARSVFRRTDHLAVVGYSFSDAHINAMIRDWLNGGRDRTVSILDYSWPRERYRSGRADFRAELITKLAIENTQDGAIEPPRVLPIEGPAAKRLHEVLHGRPSLAPTHLASIKVTKSETSFCLEVTWHGFDLSDSWVRASEETNDEFQGRNNSPLRVFARAEDLGSKSNYMMENTSIHFESWAEGETKIFYTRHDANLPIHLEVDGASIIGRQHWIGSTE
ncbi:hypothetical protein C5B99_17425 [Pseudoclavibacter sp. Z016]|nr:hypothetical protein C5B99_17425 [Pseudoclavibacter sp. Z016]